MTIVNGGGLLIPSIIGTIEMDGYLLACLGTLDAECLALILFDQRIVKFQQRVEEGFLVLICYEVVSFGKCRTWGRIVIIATA